jgi:hypothetical protein
MGRIFSMNGEKGNSFKLMLEIQKERAHKKTSTWVGNITMDQS